jgi:hypothetical protein
MDAREQVAAFDAKHGDYIVIEGWVLYETGAMREVQQPWGLLKEPPEDLYQCAKLKVKFCELKLQLACEEFNMVKTRTMSQIRANLKERRCFAPAAQEESVAILQELKKKVKKYQKLLEEAKINLENSKPVQLREREISSENNRQANEQFLAELQKIEI